MLRRILKPILLSIAIVVAFSMNAMAQAPTEKPIRVVIVGLVHDHARGFIGPLSKNTNVQLVGISEPDTALAAHYSGAKLTPDAVAMTILRGLQRNRIEIVIGVSKLARLLGRLAPRTAFLLMNLIEEKNARRAP